MRRFILYSALVSLWTAGLFGQANVGTITGSIRDSETGQAVVGANITIRGSFIGAATDGNGAFMLTRIPPGSYSIIVSMLGYERLAIPDVTVGRNQTKTLDIVLRSVPLQSEPVVVTANRREQSLQEVPVSVSTVTAQMIADRNIVTLDDALRYVPGVNMTYDQVNIRGSSGYSRDVGSRVLVLLDGLPYLTGDTGEITWETIPMFQVDRVEVVKGAGSALYGSSALGGVINVITREAPSTPELRFRAFSGLYDKPRYPEWDWSPKLRFNSGLVMSYAGKVSSLDYIISAGRTVDDSYREDDSYHRWSFFSKLKYEISNSQSFTIALNYLDRSHGNFFWWQSLREATRQTDERPDALAATRRGNVSIAYKEFLSDRFFYTVKGIYFGNFWRDYSAERLNTTSVSHLFNLDVQATYDVNSRTILTFGVTGNYDHVSSDLFGAHPGVGAAAYAQDEFALMSDVKLTGGLRFDWQKVSALKSTAQLNPKLGLVYVADKETSIRASFGSGFRYPAIAELYTQGSINVSPLALVPNPDLKTETSVSYEVGINRSFAQTVSADFALFRNDFENLIEPSVRTKDDHSVIEFDNVTKARIEGFEAGIRVEWWKKFLSSDLAYTYTWPRDLADNTILKFRPRHIFYAAGNFSWNHLRLSSDFRFLSRVERIDDNLVLLIPDGDQRVAIKVVDVRASYDLIDLGLPMRVGFNINNLLNYSYVELLGNLAPVRTYFLTVEGVF